MTFFPWQGVRPGITIFTGLVLAAGILSGCGDDGNDGEATAAPSATASLNVVATTVQITALTKEVAGDAVELHGLIPPGAEPHNFEPTASDLTAIEEAELILRHGIGLDDWLDDTLEAGNEATVVTVTDDITPAQGEEDGEVVDDPHVWHDPDNDKTMVDAIAAALDAADPGNSTTYDANAAEYKQTLDETKIEVQSIIEEIPRENRKMVTDHDAFGYFATAFGLEIVASVFPVTSSEGEPSAEDTAALLDTIEEEGVKAIFSEETANPQLAATLANDAGAAIVDDLYGDSLGEPGSGAETVDGMLLANARKIADALK